MATRGNRNNLNGGKVQWHTLPGVDEFMKEVWEDGASASRIALLLSDKYGVIVSRNAVIGRMSRQGMTSRATPGKGRTITVRKPKPERPPANRQHAQRIREAPSALKKIEQAPLIAPEQHQHIAYPDLGEADCSWPISGSGMTMVCCGGKQMIKPNGRRAPYCAFHMKAQGVKT